MTIGASFDENRAYHGAMGQAAAQIGRNDRYCPHRRERPPKHDAGASVTEEFVRDLLAGLASRDPTAAWKDFLRRYSPPIMQIVRRYESDRQCADECFEHVCQALSDDRFRRLLSFQLSGSAKFRTWLMAVTANLCIDWGRKQRGRFRPIRAVSQLPELEQLVFRYMFVRGMRRTECLRSLANRYPDLTEQQLSEINARLFVQLTPQQRWQAGTRMSATGAQTADTLSLDVLEPAFQPECTQPGPEEVVQTDQERERLVAALAQLPSTLRLLLRLRFEQNLTLAEVARLTGMQDQFRAHRQIQTALSALAEILHDPASGASRKLP